MARKSKSSVDVDVNVKGKGTKKTTLEMKNLGKQTDKVSKSTAQANRNWKGASAQSSGASKNFSKMSQGMGGIVGAYATLAANIFAIGAAFRFLQSAGDLEKLKEGQVLYASATGVALRSLTNDIVAATDAQVTFTDAAQSAAIGKAAGMSNEQLVKLGKGAKDVSIILGRDVTDSFNRLVRGVTKAEPELLDELGIILRLADASEKYGAQIGKTADELTQYEKSQAVTVEVLDQLDSKYGRIMAAMAPTGNEFTKLGKAFDDIVNQIKEFASWIAGPIAETLTRMPYLMVGLLISMGNQLLKTGLASWAANAKVRADELAMGYAHAQAKLEDLQRTQKKRTEGLGLKVDRRGTQLKAPVTKGKIAKGGFDQVAAGGASKLSAVQRRAMKGVIDRSKTMTAKMKKHWYTLLNDVKLKNKTTTADINHKWKQTVGAIQVQYNRLKVGFAATMGAIKGAAAATGAFLSRALGIISMISMVATLAISAYQWVKNATSAKDATEEVADGFEVASTKVKELNTEFEKFNEVQKIIIEDGNGFLQFFEAMGNRIGQLSVSMSTVMFDSVKEGFLEIQQASEETRQKMYDRSTREASAFLGIGWAADATGVDLATIDARIEEIKAKRTELQGTMEIEASEIDYNLKGRLAAGIATGGVGLAASFAGPIIQKTLGTDAAVAYHDGWMEKWQTLKFWDKSEIEEEDTWAYKFGSHEEGSPAVDAALKGMEDDIKAQEALKAEAIKMKEAYEGNLIAYLQAGMGPEEGREERIEFGNYLQDQLDAMTLASDKFGGATNPVTEYLNVLKELKSLGPEELADPKAWDEVTNRLKEASVAAQAFGTTIGNAGRMGKDNLQETNKVLMDLQKRSTEGRLADTLRQELELRKEIAGIREETTMFGKKGEQRFAPEGLGGAELRIWVERGLEIERHIKLMDHLDEMKDKSKKRTLTTALEEKKALLGTTKLVGARIKMQYQLEKNENKILDIDDQILAIQEKIIETGKAEKQQIRELENLYLQTDAYAMQNEELERKLDYTMQIADAASQALEGGLQKTFSSFMKGEENSLTDAMRSLAEGIFDAVADTAAKQLTEVVMGAFGFKTEAEKIKEAMDAAATRHALLIEAAVQAGVDNQANIKAQVDERLLDAAAEEAKNYQGPAISEEDQLSADEAAAAAVRQGQLDAAEAYVTANGRINEHANALADAAELIRFNSDPANFMSPADKNAARDAAERLERGDVPRVPLEGHRGPTMIAKQLAADDAAWVARRVLGVGGVWMEPHGGIRGSIPEDQQPAATGPGGTALADLTHWLPDARADFHAMNIQQIKDDPYFARDDMHAQLEMEAALAQYKTYWDLGEGFFRSGMDGHSISVHDTHVEAKLQELFGGGTGAGAGAGPGAGPGAGLGLGPGAEKKEFVPQWEGEVEGWRDTKKGMTGSAAPGSTDAFGNPIGEPIKKGMFAGIIDPFKKLFTDDSPWMTKLGDFFGGEGSFLSGLGGIFGGLGDMLGGLLSGGGDAMGGIMSIVGAMFGVPLAKGGIVKGGFRKFARGGIASSPTLGLIGEGRHNEAVVPLPDGKGIPVDMRSSAQNNNVTVNVSGSDGQIQTSGNDREQLGNAIARAVQEELQNQKRAGGILNRYGTA